MIEIDKEQEKLRQRVMNDKMLHDELVKMVTERRDFSKRILADRYEAFRKAERQHLAYVDVSETDRAGNLLFKGPKDIIIPYTYAILQTRLTYFFFSFVTKSPMVPLSGVGPQDDVPAKLMEVLQDYQSSETMAAKILYCFLQDAERYGFGVLKNVWYSDSEKRWVVTRKELTFMGFKLLDRFIRERKDVVTYEGNLPVNVSPYNFLPDMRVNISNIKRMEFCGHAFVESFNTIKRKEANGEYFNVDAIPYLSSKTESRPQDTSEEFSNDSDLGKIVGVDVNATGNMIGSDTRSKDALNADGIEMLIRLIPKDHKISDSTQPEEYLFTIANNQTLIKLEPNIYNEFNYYVGECNHDYNSPVNKSNVDMYNELQDTLSWLFNSHMANVRKAINDSIIVDPSIIELKDLLSDKPVKIIRVKEDHQGRIGAVSEGAKQLTINDITRGHIGDAQTVMNLIQRVSAATDNIMGMVEEVKRTATETSSTINLATARLKLTSFLYYIMAIRPMFKAWTFNTQGLLTEGRYFKITDEIAQALGKDPAEIKNRIFVKPEDLYGNFDFNIPPLDMPIDKHTMAKVWGEIISGVVKDPILRSKFDIVPMFRQLVWNMGVNNVRDFEVKTQVMPDAQVQKMAQEGSIAPLNEAAPVSDGQMQEAMGRMNGGM